MSKTFNTFDKLIRQQHELLHKPANACYIPACDRVASKAVRGIGTGQIHFYCKECAEDLTTVFYVLFKAVED